MAAMPLSCLRCVSGLRSSAFSMSSLAAALPPPSSRFLGLGSLSRSHQQHSDFSTTSALSESRKKRLARLKKKNNLDRRMLKDRMLELSKPDPVLGHQTNEEGQKVWLESELAKIVLNKDNVWGVKEDRRGNLVPIEQVDASTATNEFDTKAAQDAATLGGPQRLNFGLDTNDRQLLFQDLPQVMVKDRVLDSWNLGVLIRGTSSPADIEAFEQEYQKVQNEEEGNKEALARILDLRNASGKGIQLENIRRIIAHFGNHTDTGSPEVQAAVLTYRIRNLHEHLLTNRHDNSNRRSMTILIHQRAKLLRYLKRKKPERYYAILPRIGIEARAVEGEIIVPGKPKITRA